MAEIVIIALQPVSCPLSIASTRLHQFSSVCFRNGSTQTSSLVPTGKAVIPLVFCNLIALHNVFSAKNIGWSGLRSRVSSTWSGLHAEMLYNPLASPSAINISLNSQKKLNSIVLTTLFNLQDNNVMRESMIIWSFEKLMVYKPLCLVLRVMVG